MLVCLATILSENLFEGSAKLDVEDRVNDRVQEAVDVAEPDEEREQDLVQMTNGAVVEQIVSNADCVDNVDREERNPAQHEHTCQTIDK